MEYKPTKPLNWPIRVKLMLAVMASQIALSTLLFYVVVGKYDHALNTHAKNTHREIDVLLSAAVVEPMLQRDFAAMQEISNDLTSKNVLLGISISAITGNVIAESGDATSIRSLSQSDDAGAINWAQATQIRKVNTISFANQELGTIRFAISLKEQANARQLFVDQFLTIACMVTLGSIFMSLLLSGRLVSRIKALKRVSDAAISGNFDRRIQVVSNDEIGQLGSTFNRMAAAIDERMKALIKSEVLKTSYLHSAHTEKARLTSLLNSMRFGIVFLNNRQEVIYVNDAMRKMWPSNLPEFIGPATNHGRERILDDGRIIFETSHSVLSDLQEGEEGLPETDRSIGSLWVFEDITDERNAQMTIQFLAERDSLTGLYNRRSFSAALSQAIERTPDKKMALVYVDLDSFKLINDLHGHQQGDKVLIEIAGKLSAATRSSDVVARIGGDEFVILIQDIEPQDQAHWCDRLLMQLSNHEASNSQIGMAPTCSVGIAWYPSDGSNADDLLACADEAMYDAKRAGKNAWRNFQKHSDRDFEKVQAVLWNERINSALRSDGFDIFLQGVHRVHDRSIHHFEALVRMPDPENLGQFFNPGQFIGHAETSGKITQLDRWMIKNVIALLAANPDIPPIAVNVSAVTVCDLSLSCFVAQQLQAYAVSGERLHLELTETAALADIQSAQTAVASLKKLGCEVCLDDFGSGFASLAYLKLIDANYLKIDGMFIKDVNKERENQVLLRAIVDIAESSNRHTVAEWIEDEAMFETIKSFKVTLAQGFLLSMPEPALIVIANHAAKSQAQVCLAH
jgi:diguanylate cyclase (GGDEF)-like protein